VGANIIDKLGAVPWYGGIFVIEKYYFLPFSYFVYTSFVFDPG
jgi:hypothetical protein